MKHLAVVDDEVSLRENLEYALTREGYRVTAYPNGQMALDAWKMDQADLYVLDIIMPRMDGLEFCRQIREAGSKVPIIFLSSRDEELDRIIGFETGGDDYIGKPFSVRELTARIKAVLRRTEGDYPEECPVESGPLRLTPSSCKVSWKGREAVMTLSEFRLLMVLAKSPEAVRTRTDLYIAAFPEDQYINERAVDSHIKRIRRKLEMLGAPKDFITTIYGLGYRLGFDPE